MKKISQYFLNGLLVTVPLVLTVYVVYTIFVKIDNLFDFRIPGVGFGVTLLIIFAAGFAASNFITKHIVSFVDLLFARLPLVKMIYSAIKDLISAFVGDKKTFSKPVLVSLDPGGNVQAIGFVTKSSLENIGITGKVAVYFPQSFNFAGNLLIIPTDQVVPIDADPSDVMSLIVSGGISLNNNKK
jgi:uncharacterized membrane protein